jgi:hypothetical protein
MSEQTINLILTICGLFGLALIFALVMVFRWMVKEMKVFDKRHKQQRERIISRREYEQLKAEDLALANAGIKSYADGLRKLELNCNNCWECLKDTKSNGISFTAIRMILCAVCGNKRCPKATNHLNECTGSNEPNQKGSAYTRARHFEQ